MSDDARNTEDKNVPKGEKSDQGSKEKNDKRNSKSPVASVGKDLSKLNIISSLGFAIVGNVLVGLVIGKLLDNIFGTGKVFLITFIILGLISGLYNGFVYLLKEIERYDKDENQEARRTEERSKEDEKKDNIHK
ncbi:MAG TPA: AtpZ/AtpI family protein [Fervidobacterium sp.]|nr:AtpZ/AtpI family protein [Fervidobacterium sp.]HPT58732.1 AtpZ/AtpI family protein [Fervidobacterium sp.]